MSHLLAALRRLKLLSEQATEHPQGSLAFGLGKNFPKPFQRQPLTLSRSRWKRVPSWLPRMVLLLDMAMK